MRLLRFKDKNIFHHTTLTLISLVLNKNAILRAAKDLYSSKPTYRSFAALGMTSGINRT